MATRVLGSAGHPVGSPMVRSESVCSAVRRSWASWGARSAQYAGFVTITSSVIVTTFLFRDVQPILHRGSILRLNESCQRPRRRSSAGDRGGAHAERRVHDVDDRGAGRRIGEVSACGARGYGERLDDVARRESVLAELGRDLGLLIPG